MTGVDNDFNFLRIGDGRVFCKECGSEVSRTAKYCSGCGSSLVDMAGVGGKKDEAARNDVSGGTLYVMILAPTFLVVLVLNQFFYGSCFKMYCLAAAFPKVLILSAFVSWAIYVVGDVGKAKK